MIKSMTGFGKSSGTFNNRQISVEIKTLNSKQLDISFKASSIYHPFEPELRSLISKELVRGKVYCIIQTESLESETTGAINFNLAKSYLDQIMELKRHLKLKDNPDYLSLLIRMPDVFITKDPDAEHEEYLMVVDLLKKAISKVDDFRKKEGKILYMDISQRMKSINSLSEGISNYEKERIIKLKERIIRELNESIGNGFDRNRFEQELIYYIEKLDITEEQVRLKNHLDLFMQTLDEDTSNGRKLGFIAQEIGREINTIGAKANDKDIQKIVVEMKDELEKTREQLMNIL